MSEIKKLDHIGVAVNSIDTLAKLFENVVGLESKGMEEVTEQKVKVAFFSVGDTNIELIEPTSPDSAVAKFLEKRGEGVHHIAINVVNIEDKIKELIENGVKMIDEQPRIGAHSKKIAFVHPKSTGGVLIELCEG